MRTTAAPVIASAAIAALTAAAIAIPTEIDERNQATAVSSNDRPTGWINPNAIPTASRTADVVPFALTPDQQVDLRRQIGGLQIADLNNDGLNDLAAVIYTSNSFPAYTEFQDQIYFGNGSGIDLTPGWLADDATHSGDVQIADINADGFPDYITIHGGGIRSDNLRVYFGSAAGVSTAAAYVANASPSAWGTAGAVADIDQDGDLDIATTNQGLSPNPFRSNYIFTNTPAGLSTAPTWQSADPAVQNGLAIADINSDGAPDLAVSKWVNFPSAVYLGTPGGLPETTPSLELGPTDPNQLDGDRTVLVEDFDNNGSPDIFFNGDPGRLYDTSLNLTGYATNPPFNSPQDSRAFDIDNDGDLDLAEVHFSDGRAHIYLNRNGVLDTTPAWTFDAPEVGTALAFGDLNNDGAADLAIGYSGNTSIRIFFAPTPALPCTTDLDGSGTTDLADLLQLLASFGVDDGGNVDGDGDTDLNDLLAVLAQFGNPCP